jgi:hypothetical protein
MSRFFAGLAVIAALILFTPIPASAKSDGLRNVDQYEFSSRHRRWHRHRHWHRHGWRHRHWHRAHWHRVHWGPRWRVYRPMPVYAAPVWGAPVVVYRPWRPWGWHHRHWGWGPGWGWHRPWGWGPGWSVGFHW